MPITPGKRPPPLALPDQDGATVRLSDFTGKDVVVYFYPRDDTPGCTREACGFRDLWATLKRRGVVVLGVSPDPPERHRRFREKHDLPFTLLSDPGHETLAAWGAWGEKVLYGKRSQGVIRSTVWIGADGKVARHWPKVRGAEAHPAEVLAAIRERPSAS